MLSQHVLLSRKVGTTSTFVEADRGISSSEDCDDTGALYDVDPDDFASGVVFLIFLAE